MGAQIIKTPQGERLVVLSEAEYEALLEIAEDSADVGAIARFEARLASGDEELMPAGYVRRMIDGESPVAVWRDFRGLTAEVLARKAGITQAYLSQIETGKRGGTIATMKKLAEALKVKIDEIV